MRHHFGILCLLAAVSCPLVGFAQYDIVPGSIREEQGTLNNGDPARRQTFQIFPRRVVHYKNYIATLIRDERTGVIWFAFEGVDDIQTSRPTNTWILATSKDGRSIAGFEAAISILFFRVSNRTAGSMDSARALAMTELSVEISAFEANLETSSQIDLRRHLDLSTFSGASGLRWGDLRRVTGTDDGWLIELASHPSLAKTAFVYLSHDFRVLKVEVRKN